MLTKPCKDLLDTLLNDSNLILFTDGSSFMRGGVLYTGAAVVTELDSLQSASLLSHANTQGAELTAL